MPVPSPAPQTQPDQGVASQWQTFSDEKRHELLQKMNPDQKRNLRVYLEQRGANVPTFQLQSEKAPENARYPELGHMGYSVVDFLANAGPTVGGIGGTFMPFPIVSTAVGAMAGERARHAIRRQMYTDEPAQTVPQAAWSMGKEGALWAGPEAFMRFVLPAAWRMRQASKFFNAAERGEGIRFTPGEVSGSDMTKLMENVFEHWPGSAGTMKKFRQKQTEDIELQLERILKDINERHVPPEEATKQVQDWYRNAKAQLDPGLQAETQQVESVQESRNQGIIDQQLDTLSPRDTNALDFGKQIRKQAVGEKEGFEAEEEADLQRIKDRQKQDLDRAFDPDLNALDPITGRTSEQVGAPIQANLRAQQDAAQAAARQNIDTAANRLSPQSASSEEIGTLIKGHLREQQATAQAKLKTDIAQVRATQETNITQIIDQEAHALSPVQTSREHAGLQVQNALSDLQKQLRQTVNAKYDQVKALMGKQFATPAEMREFAETNPEARTLLDDANNLYKQEQPNFDVPIIAKILKAPPEKLASVLANASLADLRFLRDYLPPNVKQVMKRELWEALVYEASDSLTGKVNTKKLADFLKALKDDRGESIFGANYDTIASSPGRIERENAAAETQVEQLTTQATPNKLTKDILSKPPEQVADLLTTAGSNEDVRALRNEIPPEMYNAAMRDVFEKLASAKSPTDALEKLGGRGRAIFGDQYDSIAKSFRDADQATAQFSKPGLLQDILRKPAEKIADLMMTASRDDLRELKRILPPELYNSAANQVLRKVISAPKGGIVSEESLEKAWSTLEDDRAKIIFGDRYDSIKSSIARFSQINKNAEAWAAGVTERRSQSPFFQRGLYADIVDPTMPAERIVPRLRTAGHEELQRFTQSLSPEQLQDLRKNVLQSILERPGVRDQNGLINAKKFAYELQRLNEGAPRGQIIFGDQYEGLVNASKQLESLNAKTAEKVAEIAKKKTPYDTGLIARIIATDNPLLISQFMAEAGPEELRIVMHDLPPEVRQAAARNTLEHFISPARAPETLLEAGEKRVTPRGTFQTGELDPRLLSESLDSMLRQLKPERAQAIFGDQVYKNLVAMSAGLKRIGYSESSMMGKMHMAGVLSAMLAAVGTFGRIAEVGSLGVTTLTAKMVAEILTSPNLSDILVGNILRASAAIAKGVPITVDMINQSPAKYPPVDTRELIRYQHQPLDPLYQFLGLKPTSQGTPP